MDKQPIFYLGIDVSKNTLDITVKNGANISHFCIKNNLKAIGKFFKTFKGKTLCIAMENTGKYNWFLYDVLTKTNLPFYVLNALHLKRSIGLVRGKNDKIDSQRITVYIERNQDQHQVHRVSSKAIRQLKVLLNQRDNLVKNRAKLKAQSKDKAFLKLIDLDKTIMALNRSQANFLTKQIAKVEQLIKQLIKADESLAKHQKLLLTIPGIGLISCWYLLAKTENFTKITTGRKLACFAGVVPFSKQSGLFKGRDKLSNYADKGLKKILHLAALSTIRLDNDLAHFYKRKIQEGKNKMSALNAVRNKIIHIVFAVIKNQKIFENRLHLS